jgi:hypothetical protein
MGLDLYVMPIWRFKAGDFASPLESLGIAPVIVGPDGMSQREPDARPSFFTRWKANRATRRLRREIEVEVGHPVQWNDEGNVAYTRQAHGFESLRAFAKWLDYRDMFPTFDPPPENNYYNHPVMSDKLARPLTYPQIVDHSCYNGYYIPAELERVVYVEPFTSWSNFVFKHSVGSSYRLLAELERLTQVLGTDEHYEWVEGDPLEDVKVTFAQLFEVAKISRQTNLPIIFYS